jgi:hypothetical protein
MPSKLIQGIQKVYIFYIQICEALSLASVQLFDGVFCQYIQVKAGKIFGVEIIVPPKRTLLSVLIFSAPQMPIFSEIVDQHGQIASVFDNSFFISVALVAAHSNPWSMMKFDFWKGSKNPFKVYLLLRSLKLKKSR